jgi:uncharacterized protein
MIEIGTVAAINRFPVKSMGGEAMKRAILRWTGIEGNRQFAFCRAANQSHFPWLTARDLAGLVRYLARYADGANPRASDVAVTAPDGEICGFRRRPARKCGCCRSGAAPSTACRFRS